MTPPVAVVLSIEERTPVRPKLEVVALVRSTLVPVKFVALKFVVVALVPVARAKSKFAKCEVELA